MAKRPKIKTDYSIRVRFFDFEKKQWGPWKNPGHGIWQDVPTLHRQINTLTADKRKSEVEVIRNGKLADRDGNPSDKTIIVERKQTKP